ncbi:MAG: extracellular solute-binding protein, partial [Granulosicoccus sp.]
RARIIVQSKERMQPGDLHSYADLANPNWEGKICTRSGKHVYMLGLIAAQIANHGEEAARTWLQGVKQNLARKPQGNDRAQVKAISQGECDIAVINSYYMGKMQTDEEQFAWASAVDVVFPDQDSSGTHMNISGVALTKSSPNKENAVKLMEFLSSELAQKMYAEQNHEYPVNANVEPSGLVQSWGSFSHDTLPLSQVVLARTAASKMVDVVDYDN